LPDPLARLQDALAGRYRRELGVDYRLTGTVRWDQEGGRSQVRVSPELVQTTSGATRWQQSFDAPLTGVFQVQADVAERVARELGVALAAGQRRQLEERPTADLGSSRCGGTRAAPRFSGGWGCSRLDECSGSAEDRVAGEPHVHLQDGEIAPRFSSLALRAAAGVVARPARARSCVVVRSAAGR